jgi:hypothetical protein
MRALLLAAALAAPSRADAPATGNHAISSTSCFFASVTVNPPQFSTYLAEVARGGRELPPEGELFAQPLRLAGEPSSDPLVIPEAGGKHRRLDLG